MDLFTILLILFFFLLPAISKLLEQRKSQAPPQEPPHPEPYDSADVAGQPYGRTRKESGAGGDDSLAEALRQIREALGEPVPHAERRPEPTPPRPQRPEPARRTQPPSRPTQSTPLPGRGTPPPKPVTPPPRRTSEHVRRPTRFEKANLPPVDLDAPLEVEVVGGGGRYAWLVESLRDVEGARRAVKMHEILDPPPAIKNLGIRRR